MLSEQLEFYIQHIFSSQCILAFLKSHILVSVYLCVHAYLFVSLFFVKFLSKTFWKYIVESRLINLNHKEKKQPTFIFLILFINL